MLRRFPRFGFIWSTDNSVRLPVSRLITDYYPALSAKRPWTSLGYSSALLRLGEYAWILAYWTDHFYDSYC